MAQDSVTITKSRLQELERKEAELEKLRGLAKTSPAALPARTQNAVLPDANTQPAAVQPAPVRVSPPIASLPPVKKTDIVQALDLANYYHADAAAADQRYRKRSFQVQGEITGFDKGLFARYYRLIMETGQKDTKVICEVYPPDNKYEAVATRKNNSEVFGKIGDNRLPIAHAGQIAVVQGQCAGLKDGAVIISGCELKSLR